MFDHILYFKRTQKNKKKKYIFYNVCLIYDILQ